MSSIKEIQIKRNTKYKVYVGCSLREIYDNMSEATNYAIQVMTFGSDWRMSINKPHRKRWRNNYTYIDIVPIS
jgi:hypothetical protein